MGRRSEFMLEATQGAEGAMSIRPLEYRAILAAGIEASEPGNEPEPDSAARANELEARVRELEREMEERERRFELALQAARAEAREAGRSSERSEQSARIAQCAKTLTAALTEFASGRDHYLAQVEREVVHLALAIAARVLHREALMDPLLLSG